MSRKFIVSLFILAIFVSIALFIWVNISSEHRVLYLNHEWDQYRVLRNITYTAPPDYNVMMIGSRSGISAIINSESRVYLDGLIMADTFEEADFDGTHLYVTWDKSNINSDLTSINYYTGDESDYISNKTGFEIDSFGNFWMHSFKGTYRLPDNVGFNDNLRVNLSGVENNGTAVLLYENETYWLPPGGIIKFSRNMTDVSVISSNNVNFTLTYWYEVSDTITNNGLVKLSNIKRK